MSVRVITLNPGFNRVDLEVNETLEVEITAPKESVGSLYVSVTGSGTLSFRMHLEANTTLKYLWINQSDGTLKVDEHIILDSEAHLHAHYGEMTRGHHQKTTHIEYNGVGSWCDVKGAMIAFNNLKWHIKADHQAPRSYAMVSCNAIVLDKADLHLEVVGSIAKGNRGSETHQMSRIMNLGESVHGIVYPMLLIDENDVAASHAASVGQPNEDHIYYLQARGLSRLDALKLIIMGYLMPIVEGIDDPEIKAQLTQEIEEKVTGQWEH